MRSFFFCVVLIVDVVLTDVLLTSVFTLYSSQSGCEEVDTGRIVRCCETVRTFFCVFTVFKCGGGGGGYVLIVYLAECRGTAYVAPQVLVDVNHC